MSQGSPNMSTPSAQTYRRAISVTAVRKAESGTPFLYTLTLQCPEQRWSDLEGPFRYACTSFALRKPGRDFVDPEQEPWRFF